MEENPETFSPGAVAADEEFLRRVGEHILDAESFVAGSFQKNLAAWKELLGGFSRQSSKKVLKWIGERVQLLFEGTQNADPKKMRRVWSMLRRTVPKGKVEEFL